MVLDRTGYGITGPVSVVPGEEVTYEIRSNDPTRYFIHAWLDEDLTDMKRVTVSEKRETVSFIVPAKSKENGTFWVSATQSPWLGVQGKAFASRISETSVSNMKAHFSWLEKQAGPVLNGDPFYQWLRAQENLPNQEQVLKAVQSRLVAPHFQAPLINALPKKQMA